MTRPRCATSRPAWASPSAAHGIITDLASRYVVKQKTAAATATRSRRTCRRPPAPGARHRRKSPPSSRPGRHYRTRAERVSVIQPQPPGAPPGLAAPGGPGNRPRIAAVRAACSARLAVARDQPPSRTATGTAPLTRCQDPAEPVSIPIASAPAARPRPCSPEWRPPSGGAAPARRRPARPPRPPRPLARQGDDSNRPEPPPPGPRRQGREPGQAVVQQHGQDLADGGLPAAGLAQRQVRLDLVAVAERPSFCFTTSPALARSVMMPWALRSVMPRLAEMSRSRAPGRGRCTAAPGVVGQETPLRHAVVSTIHFRNTLLASGSCGLLVAADRLMQRLFRLSYEQCYPDKLARRGSAHVSVKDLVVAEHQRVQVQPAAMIGNRPGRVEQAAEEHQRPGQRSPRRGSTPPAAPGSPSSPAPGTSRRPALRPRPSAPCGSRPRPASVTTSRSGRPARNRRAQRAGMRSGRPSDQEEDHRVVQALQPPAPAVRPVTAVIQHADPEQGAHAGHVDGDGRDPRRSMPPQAAACPPPRRPKPDQVQPAEHNRLGIIDAAPGVVKRVRYPRPRRRWRGIPGRPLPPRLRPGRVPESGCLPPAPARF